MKYVVSLENFFNSKWDGWIVGIVLVCVETFVEKIYYFCENGKYPKIVMEPGTAIRDIEPSTSHPPRNVYHLNTSLYVLDVVRMFQDHPKYCDGLKESDIVNMLSKEDFACGDLDSQVRMALKELTSTGFIRLIQQGYRTMGPYAKLAMARTPRQFNGAWDRLCELQKATSPVTVFKTQLPGATNDAKPKKLDEKFKKLVKDNAKCKERI